MRMLVRVGSIVVWVLQALLAVMFVLIGVAKFGDPSWVRHFARWGYPDGFFMVIGVLELAAGLSLLVPRVASYGAALLVVIMIGASATHAVHGESARVIGPLLYAALLTVVAVVRWPRAMRLPPRRPPARLEPV